MSDDYGAFFERVTGHAPYPYQSRLATAEVWPELLNVPTGLGKTAAVAVAWLWRRLHGVSGTPSRLVYCLPMRVLVEQTVRHAREWVDAARPEFEVCNRAPPGVHVLMGGETDTDWVLHPDRPSIVIGTQDMLLSRALMRGFGMRPYEWPLHFAFLHNDAFWVYDEVQLMGPALATSSQLEGFRRDSSLARPSLSLWMSATLQPGWLDTVDFRPHLPSLRAISLSDADRTKADHRLGAVKRLERASVRLEHMGTKAAYAASLAEAVLAAHRQGTQTLVILNRVSRAQELFRALRLSSSETPSILLLHARFRRAERADIERQLRESNVDRIVVATQAIEAGVDVTSATMFTELAPWASLVQRFGRCNRDGAVEDGANIYWIDVDDRDEFALPYDAATLAHARESLDGLSSAGIHDLPAVQQECRISMVLRRKDLTELFDTEPDLSGFHIDVSPYIRDPGVPQVQVFWREFDDRPEDEKWPTAEELCPVSIGQIRDYVGKTIRKRPRRWWRWDGLTRRWVGGGRKQIPPPGTTVLLRAEEGGYDTDLGFDAGAKVPVTVLPPPADLDDAMDTDPYSIGRRFITLQEHTEHVVEEAAALASDLELDDAISRSLDLAAHWHDVGKAHPAFQTAMRDYLDADESVLQTEGAIWAKSSGSGPPKYRIDEDGESTSRRYFRHELASMLAWLEHGDNDELVAYMIAAHHGKLRLALRALPNETATPDGGRFARGLWEGDVVPPVDLNGLSVPETEIRLDIMELGRGAQGPSWTERTRRLLAELGPFRLAWYEALLRVADQRASAAEKGPPDQETPSSGESERGRREGSGA